MNEIEEIKECIMKGCSNERFKNKILCEKHWKGRRIKHNYKDDWDGY